MISEGYLEECPVQNGFGSTVDLSREGQRWLRKATVSDDYTMLVSANHELLALDRDQSRPELTLSASARFVIITCVPVVVCCSLILSIIFKISCSY